MIALVPGVGGCPAYAGMDPIGSVFPAIGAGLPRLRGDGPYGSADASGSVQAAPPTRGWTPPVTVRRSPGIGCPAYAGMDPTSVARASSVPWLPRLRGDGPAT